LKEEVVEEVATDNAHGAAPSDDTNNQPDIHEEQLVCKLSGSSTRITETGLEPKLFFEHGLGITVGAMFVQD
jgi:hypothetical protein